MFDRIEELVHRFEELEVLLNDPAVLSDANEYRKRMKERAELEPVVKAYLHFKERNRALEEATSMLYEEKDEEMRDLLKEEIAALKEELPGLEMELKLLLLPKDPNDDKNVILEIRAGAGGEEAGLFVADLYRMYLRYAEMQNWKVETLDFNESGIGGMSRVTCMISGKGAYSKLKFESGVQRVQRIPKTESNGKIQSSTVTVAILPEAEEVDVQINPEDCRIDVFRASGNGGQCVNTTDSAVRLTHIPTGIVISCQDEKSQLKNRDKAMKVLRAKLYELECQKAHDCVAAERKAQVGTGDRSEKIRTYNFPQGRVTDHRINVSFYQIDSILDGNLQVVIDQLSAASQAEKLARLNEL